LASFFLFPFDVPLFGHFACAEPPFSPTFLAPRTHTFFSFSGLRYCLSFFLLSFHSIVIHLSFVSRPCVDFFSPFQKLFACNSFPFLLRVVSTYFRTPGYLLLCVPWLCSFFWVDLVTRVNEPCRRPHPGFTSPPLSCFAFLQLPWTTLPLFLKDLLLHVPPCLI